VFDRATGGSFDIDINGILMGLFGETATDSFAYTNHMIDLSTIDGRDVILLDVVYKEPSLNDALADAIVAIDAETFDVIETADGNAYFEWLTEVGTMSETASEQIYKIQHRVLSDSEKDSSSEDVQQFHQNGLTRVTTADGTTILAATHKTDGEVVIVKCPFTYTSEEGGGSIVQRFGSPSIYVNDKTSEKHAFGLAAADNSLTALHNVYYTLYPDGRETMTLFVNIQENAQMSQIFEFDLKLTPEPASAYDDTVFETDYKVAVLDYATGTWGGARPVGQGVYLVGRNGMAAYGVDTVSANVTVPQVSKDTEVYDSFAFVTL